MTVSNTRDVLPFTSDSVRMRSSTCYEAEVTSPMSQLYCNPRRATLHALSSFNSIFVKVTTICVPLRQEAAHRLSRLRNKFPILGKWFPVWKGVQGCGPPSGLECHLWCHSWTSKVIFYFDPYWGSMTLAIPYLPGSTVHGERAIHAVSQGRGKFLRASSSPSSCPSICLHVFLLSGLWPLEPRTRPIDGVSASPFQTAPEGVLSLDSEAEASETIVGLDRHGASLHRTLWRGGGV